MKPTFLLHSGEMDTDYALFVSAPESDKAKGPWPTVLFMDGDDQFAAAARAYQTQRAAGRIPALLLVGVGYGASYANPRNRRGRDYTPTAHSDEPTSGGADRFLQFLQLTLWPELDRRYPVCADQRGIAGHSLGSLLVLHAMWRDPPFFTHHLASAPAIWWDDRSIMRLAARRYSQNPTLNAHLFLSVGEEDTASMTGDLNLLEHELRAHPFAGLKVTTKNFPRRNHFNVLEDAFGTGLSVLFGSGANGSS